jgi:hypothetical protein
MEVTEEKEQREDKRIRLETVQKRIGDMKDRSH